MRFKIQPIGVFVEKIKQNGNYQRIMKRRLILWYFSVSMMVLFCLAAVCSEIRLCKTGSLTGNADT